MSNKPMSGTKMYRIRSQSRDGYPDSHGYYETREEAMDVANELRSHYCNRNIKYWIIEVN
jgi:hypothetical protein